jgi:hypothetical protein
MKLFFDTEFTGLHQNTTLISLGIISETGRSFYAEFTDYDKLQCDDWINNNVISKLHIKKNNTIFNDEILGDTKYIKNRLEDYLSEFDEIEIWSDCLSYDWVLFNELFGGAFNIPKNINYIPFDICTLFKIKNIDPDINREEFAFGGKENIPESAKKHNALWDAIVIRTCYNRLMEL